MGLISVPSQLCPGAHRASPVCREVRESVCERVQRRAGGGAGSPRAAAAQHSAPPARRGIGAGRAARDSGTARHHTRPADAHTGRPHSGGRSQRQPAGRDGNVGEPLTGVTEPARLPGHAIWREARAYKEDKTTMKTDSRPDPLRLQRNQNHLVRCCQESYFRDRTGFPNLSKI